MWNNSNRDSRFKHIIEGSLAFVAVMVVCFSIAPRVYPQENIYNIMFDISASILGALISVNIAEKIFTNRQKGNQEQRRQRNLLYIRLSVNDVVINLNRVTCAVRQAVEIKTDYFTAGNTDDIISIIKNIIDVFRNKKSEGDLGKVTDIVYNSFKTGAGDDLRHSISDLNTNIDNFLRINITDLDYEYDEIYELTKLKEKASMFLRIYDMSGKVAYVKAFILEYTLEFIEVLEKGIKKEKIYSYKYLNSKYGK